MSYTIKAAAVTQKAANGEFNSDNLNLNGKVLSIENANNGFKGAGSMKPVFAVALASSQYNGFAGAALTALNDRLPMLKEDESRVAATLSDYFADSRHALEQCNCDVNGLALAVLVGYENKLAAASMGNACVLRYSDGDLEKVNAAEATQEQPVCSFGTIANISDGDLFVLCPEQVLSVMTEGEIIVALNAADGNEKKAVQMLSSKFAKRASDACVTFIVVRVEKQEEAFVPPVAEENVVAAPVALPVEEEAVNIYEGEAEEYAEADEYYEEEAETDPRKKIILWVSLCAALVVLMVVTGFAAYKISLAKGQSDLAAGLVVAGSDAQYDLNIDLTTEAASTEEATSEEATSEEATSEEATEEATTESTTSSSDSDYDDDYDYDYDEDDDDDYDYGYEEDTDTVATVPRPTEAPTQAPTEAPTQAPTEAPTQAPAEPPAGDTDDEDEMPDGPIEAPGDVPGGNSGDTPGGNFGDISGGNEFVPAG